MRLFTPAFFVELFVTTRSVLRNVHFTEDIVILTFFFSFLVEILKVSEYISESFFGAQTGRDS
jgi:thiosulfate reductase cytochrome b subunit